MACAGSKWIEILIIYNTCACMRYNAGKEGKCTAVYKQVRPLVRIIAPVKITRANYMLGLLNGRSAANAGLHSLA